MSERDGYQPGVPCWVDALVPDPRRAMDFYGELFGWEFEGPGRMPGDPPGEYFVARLRGREVAGVGTQQAAGPPAWSTYVEVTSADDAAQAVTRAGGQVVMAPFDAPPAGRVAVVADPAGAVVCLWQPDQRRGAQLVNEPSAWAMSALHTSAPDAAGAFYRDVFGWETEPFGPPGVKLFRLPGFVGGEPAQPVPRDVVAAMVPLAEAGAPAHWSVDFWVSDADALADAAPKLGGTVVVAPFDSIPTRQAVLADPAGVVFSVTTAPGPTR